MSTTTRNIAITVVVLTVISLIVYYVSFSNAARATLSERQGNQNV